MNLHLLNDHEKSKYRSLWEEAVRNARRCRRGEVQINEFYDPLKDAEAFIRDKALLDSRSAVPQSLEEYFARAAGIHADRFLTYDDILQLAADAFRAAANLGAANLEAMLSLLEQGGAKVIRGTNNEPDFIPTADGALKSPRHTNPKSFKPVFEPRLLWLIEGLERNGIYTDDLVIHVRHPDPRKLRKTPYVLVEIPRHRKQIILANQRGEITFVADDCFELSMWESLHKYQLKTLPGVKPVILRDKDRWLNRILSLVNGDTGLKAHTPKTNLEQYTQSPKRNKAPYSVALILECIQKTHEETGEYPNMKSGLILYGPLADGKRTWHSVDTSMKVIWREKNPPSSRNGLTRENCPYPSLDHLKDQHGMNDNYNGQDIVDSLTETHEVTGEYPNINSGLILYGSLANGKRTWESVDTSMRVIWREKNPPSSSNGLTRENCPYLNLADIKNKNSMKDDNSYTVKDIIQSLRTAYATTEEWPNERTGLILYGPLANGKRKWGSVAASMRVIWREQNPVISSNGLTRVNCPYPSLDHLKAQHAMNDDYNVQNIIDSLTETHEETGEYPNINSGLILYGSLANGKRTWQSVNASMDSISREKNPVISCNGLTRVNCPYPSLASLKAFVINSLSCNQSSFKGLDNVEPR